MRRQSHQDEKEDEEEQEEDMRERYLAGRIGFWLLHQVDQVWRSQFPQTLQ